ncbi:unnamed protein product [Polarella glacialis]|uniref:Protein kinase domain-containing protein n=1 Tax=Polarella glacialis TaxID=89957 RepID=A0A813ETR6_POLGL|nr:unnamed protein product [Polarella glacialis]
MRVGKLLLAILVASNLVNFTLGQVTSFCNPNPLTCTGTTTTLDRSSNPFDGVNVGWGAKPVAVDWDGDGDIDLLVGNWDGRIQFFERTADAALVEQTGNSNPFDDAALVEQTGNSNPFVGIDVGLNAQPSAVDWDGDGDIDLLVGNQDGRILFFERSANASLIERTGSSNPFDGIDVGLDAAPFPVDWDGDGDIDLLVGNQDGRIFFFERTADTKLIGRTGSSNPFDGINAGDNASPFAADWDGDGDIDLLVGNWDGRIQFFERSADASLIEQTGSSNPFDGISDGNFAAPFAVDWDGDGDIDLIVGILDGQLLGRILFFERSANASLIEQTGSSNPFDGIADGLNSPSAVDWDGDGDIDFLSGQVSGRIQFFERSADASLVQRTGSSNPFDGVNVGNFAKPVAVDWDGDGDIDLIVGNWDGRIQFFERTADAALVEQTGNSNPFVGIDVGLNAKPSAVDWDGDGDIDLLVGNQDGRILFFERSANASLIERTGSSNPFDGIDVGLDAVPLATSTFLLAILMAASSSSAPPAYAARIRQEAAAAADMPKTIGYAATDLWGPESSVSVYVVDASGLSVADPSVESCSEGAFQSSDMQHIMTIGVVEHWFIKPSDITPGPKSILGSGSFGIVVKGMLNYATEVAIKIPKTRFQSREESQLANEMRLFRHIRHSNIVLFRGATLMVINGGSPCLSLVLEWVNGGNFGEYMQQLRSNAVFEADGHAFAYKILLDVARGMTYLHKLTPVILHLDLKPANILVEKEVPPKGKITNFGLSRFARNSLPQHKVGTEKYMAPEVAQRKPYGPAADVFSFGRIITWTITGELCPELISSTSFKGQEDACLFQTLDEVASSCLEEEPHMRPHFFQVYDRLTTPPTTTTKIVL